MEILTSSKQPPIPANPITATLGEITSNTPTCDGEDARQQGLSPALAASYTRSPRLTSPVVPPLLSSMDSPGSEKDPSAMLFQEKLLSSPCPGNTNQPVSQQSSNSLPDSGQETSLALGSHPNSTSHLSVKKNLGRSSSVKSSPHTTRGSVKKQPLSLRHSFPLSTQNSTQQGAAGKAPHPDRPGSTKSNGSADHVNRSRPSTLLPRRRKRKSKRGILRTASLNSLSHNTIRGAISSALHLGLGHIGPAAAMSGEDILSDMTPTSPTQEVGYEFVLVSCVNYTELVEVDSSEDSSCIYEFLAAQKMTQTVRAPS